MRSRFHWHLLMPEEPGGVHAQEAGGHHQLVGESHQVLARGAVHTMAFLRAKIVSIER
jgi:hypothetical protein